MSYPQQQPSAQDRSLGELFGELMRETSNLIRQEITLAKTEMTQKAAEAGKNIGAIAVGGMVLYMGLLGIMAAITLLLIHLGMSPWKSALIVGVVVAAIGAGLVSKGLKALKEMDSMPRRTQETLKEDAKWAKDQMR